MDNQASANNQEVLRPEVVHFFDEDTNTFSYVVKDPKSNTCAIVDSVLNFDMASGSVSYEGADAIIAYVREKNLDLQWILETHIHADHLTSAPYIKEKLGGKIAIGEHVRTVQATFAKIFNTGADFSPDGRQFDHLFKNDELYQIGNLNARVLHTPGHTPACTSHVIGDAVFVGDTLFMPDAGTARADFPGGDATQLFQSIRKILSLPGNTRVFMCHDYGTDDRKELAFETTIAEELARNIHVNAEVDEADFVAMRTARDSTLDMPRLILPSLQVNMRAGHLPEPESNQLSYLKLPINAFK